jgi:hypothetical protein
VCVYGGGSAVMRAGGACLVVLWCETTTALVGFVSVDGISIPSRSSQRSAAPLQPTPTTDAVLLTFEAGGLGENTDIHYEGFVRYS